MKTDRLHSLARQIDTLLRGELGRGIDLARLLADGRYARDVLFVCESLDGAEGAALAVQFRRAQAAAHAPAAPLSWGLVMHSLFGPIAEAPLPPTQARQPSNPSSRHAARGPEAEDSGWLRWGKRKPTAADHIGQRLNPPH